MNSPNRSWKTIEVVVKITARCNINCTYCYVFNKSDQSYKEQAVYMSTDTVSQLAQFLVEGAKSVGAEKVMIDFHGGEPLMIKKERFDQMCGILRTTIEQVCSVDLGLQTNAILVDDEWIELFEKHRVSVGVSLDGVKEINDRERVDHNGLGTFDRTIDGYRLLRRAKNKGLLRGLGMLSVSNPSASAEETYALFAEELGAEAFNLLLPIDTHDSFDFTNSAAYGKFLCEVFDLWFDTPGPRPRIRLFENVLGFFRLGSQAAESYRSARNTGHLVFMVTSDGGLGPDDTLRTANLNLFDRHNIFESTLLDFVNAPIQRSLHDAHDTLPAKCTECSWRNLCRGGAAHGRIINRYSDQQGFNNPSVLCDSLQQLYGHISARLLKAGMDFEKITDCLLNEEITWRSYESPCPFGTGGDYSAKNASGRFAQVPILPVRS